MIESIHLQMLATGNIEDQINARPFATHFTSPKAKKETAAQVKDRESRDEAEVPESEEDLESVNDDPEPSIAPSPLRSYFPI